MKPDITPPRNYQRGSVRPPQRPVPPRRPVPQRVTSGKRVVPIDDVRRVTPAKQPPVQVSPPSEPMKRDTPAPKPAKNPEPQKPVPPKPAKKWLRFSVKKHGLLVLAAIVLLITGYVAVDTWLTNRQTRAITSGNDSVNANAATWTKEDEGKDESDLPAGTLANYTVAPDLPRALYIDKLNIAARVLPMSVNTDGSVQSPINIFDAGWYTGSMKPGEIGATFMDGHASGATREGLFAYLDTLAAGDTVRVEKGDGTELTYRVTKVETVPLEDVDMQKVLLPHGNALRGLNLMTCTGKWLPEKLTYDHRVIVYTEQVE